MKIHEKAAALKRAELRLQSLEVEEQSLREQIAESERRRSQVREELQKQRVRVEADELVPPEVVERWRELGDGKYRSMKRIHKELQEIRRQMEEDDVLHAERLSAMKQSISRSDQWLVLVDTDLTVAKLAIGELQREVGKLQVSVNKLGDGLGGVQGNIGGLTARSSGRLRLRRPCVPHGWIGCGQAHTNNTDVWCGRRHPRCDGGEEPAQAPRSTSAGGGGRSPSSRGREAAFLRGWEGFHRLSGQEREHQSGRESLREKF
ncbi:MAG: hypothetical protein KF760_26890 [Candidatus Eremiobacteraeota bacterium]|nr:hypothetical protein [Candidatus Eremiobacteraeota bacterium]MCW5872131.1 hypothetical protein [Candidatus Eremiobacteraeota bacterium]